MGMDGRGFSGEGCLGRPTLCTLEPGCLPPFLSLHRLHSCGVHPPVLKATLRARAVKWGNLPGDVCVWLNVYVGAIQ